MIRGMYGAQACSSRSTMARLLPVDAGMVRLDEDADIVPFDVSLAHVGWAARRPLPSTRLVPPVSVAAPAASPAPSGPHDDLGACADDRSRRVVASRRMSKRRAQPDGRTTPFESAASPNHDPMPAAHTRPRGTRAEPAAHRPCAPSAIRQRLADERVEDRPSRSAGGQPHPAVLSANGDGDRDVRN